MNGFQSFVLAVLVLVAGVVLILAGHEVPGEVALSAALGAAGLHAVIASKGGT